MNPNDFDNCDLTFKEQCLIVYEGLKRGVKYDGCTAVPDFDFGKDCCAEHDFHYQIGDCSRYEADKRLRDCISKKGYKGIAWAYFIGVRLLGWKFYKGKK